MTREIWLFLFVLGTILLNWPFLDIFSLSLPFYLFGVWGFMILGIGLIVRKAGRKGPGRV